MTDLPNTTSVRIQEHKRTQDPTRRDVSDERCLGLVRQERGERTPWRTFLTAHWETVAATDFFTIEVATVRRLVTYCVLVVIEFFLPKVHIAGITPGPAGAFMMQVGRNLTDPLDGFLRGKGLLILDRDQKFTTEFCDLLEHAGTDVVRAAVRFAESERLRRRERALRCDDDVVCS